MSNLKKNIIQGAFWSSAVQFLSLIIILCTNIWMTRILSPRDFGQVGIFMFFVVLCNVFSEGGLSGALVRKKNPSNRDYSTVFVYNLVISVILYIILFLSAEIISVYYDDPELRMLIKVGGVVLVINAFQIVPDAKLVGNLRFKQKAIYRLLSVIIGSLLGIITCNLGFGVWSLLIMQITTSITQTLLLLMGDSFNLSFVFSKNSFKDLFGFGVNTALSSIINTAFDNIYQLIVGRYFSLNQVGYFYQAKKLQEVPGGIINMLTQNVIFSSLSKLQDDKIQFMRAYNKIALLFFVTLGLISIFIFTYAEQIILTLYGVKWINAVFYMQLLTIATFFSFSELINRIIYKVFNQTKQLLYLEILKKIAHIVSILIGIFTMNLKALLIGFVVSSFIGYLLSYYFSRKVLDQTDTLELKSLFKILFTSILTCVTIQYLIDFLGLLNFKILFTIPFLLLFYFLILRILGIMNILFESKQIFNIIRK